MARTDNCYDNDSTPMNTPKKLPRKTYRTPFQSRYHTPSTSKRTQQLNSQHIHQSWGEEHSMSDGTGFISPNSKAFTKPSRVEKWDLSKLFDILEIDVLVKNIVEMLGESNIFLIEEIVKSLGKPTAIELMKTTKIIQRLGGLELPCSPSINSKRSKRTEGGVFIQLAKSKFCSDTWKEISRLSQKKKRKNNKKRNSTTTPRHKHETPNKKLFGDYSNTGVEENIAPKINSGQRFLENINVYRTEPETIKEKINGQYSPEKKSIGERLYHHVCAHEPNHTGKITGMLLQSMDNLNLSELVQRPKILKEVVNEAVRVYKEAEAVNDEPPNDNRQNIDLGQKLYQEVSAHLSKLPEYQCLTGKITGMLLEMPTGLLKHALEKTDRLKPYLLNSINVLQVEKEKLGEILYEKIKMYTDKVDKVTGMLLELDPIYLNTLKDDPRSLKEKVDECLDLLGANNLFMDFVSPCKKRIKSPRC